MPLLFSYGSLQRIDVQRATFGRALEGARDELVAFELIPPTANGSPHANVIPGRTDSRVAGTAFEVTDTELAAADEYERRDGYLRVAAKLASGREVWVYLDSGKQGD